MGTPTTNKGYIQPSVGADYGTWGTELNGNWGVLDSNLAGQTQINAAGNSNITLTSSQAQSLSYYLFGALTGDISLIFPQVGGLYVVFNNTTGAHTITAKMPTGSSIPVPQGYSIVLLADGNNIYSATSAYVQQGTSVTFGAVTTTKLTATAGVDVTGPDSGGFYYRAVNGSYGSGILADGTNTYFAVTANGNPNGTFSIIPFQWSNNNGTVFFNHLVQFQAVNVASTLTLAQGYQTTGGATPVSNANSGWAVPVNGGAQGYSSSGTPLVLGTGTVGNIIGFYFGNFSYSGGISINNTGSVAYNTSSDIALKIVKGPIEGAMSYVRRLAPTWFNWKSAPDGMPIFGFIAQKLARVWPQAVTARKGRPGQKGFIPAQVDASKLVPLLSAALIELDERLAAVEARK